MGHFGFGNRAEELVRNRSGPLQGGIRIHALLVGERALPDADAALILKAAAGVDKDVFAKRNIFAEIRIKRRQHLRRTVRKPLSQDAQTKKENEKPEGGNAVAFSPWSTIQ